MMVYRSTREDYEEEMEEFKGLEEDQVLDGLIVANSVHKHLRSAQCHWSTAYNA